MANVHQNTMIKPASVKPATPSLYKVILHNDDFTPMDFVVEVLERFFAKNREQAVQIMLKIHTEGTGVGGIYPQEIAETKMHQVLYRAREMEHPLQCTIEQA